MAENRIPSGKYKGRLLSELSDTSLQSMYGAWIDSKNLKTHEFVADIHLEIRRRGLSSVGNNKPIAAPLPATAAKQTEATLPGVIPSGKHRGKRLTELSDQSLLAMQGSWIESYHLSRSAFLNEIHAEVARRGFTVHPARPDKRKKPKQWKRPHPISSQRVHMSVVREWLELRGKTVPVGRKDALRFLLYELGVFRSGVNVFKQLEQLFESERLSPLVAEFKRFVGERNGDVSDEDYESTKEFIEKMGQIL